jgi:ankyrin repeat protein
VAAATLASSTARGHETDQYSVPLGREFADLRYHFSDDIHDRLERAVEKLNRRIDRSRRWDPTGAGARRFQSPDTVAGAVFAEFPGLILHVESIERALRDPALQARYPGLLLGYQPAVWIYHHPMLILDVLKFPRYWRTSTIMIDGTYLGTDKPVHFVHMGYIYFQNYRQALARGDDEAEAMRKVLGVGGGINLISENALLGGISTGVRSNADLAADFAGLKFYRNLTEEVRLEGEMQPPLLVHDGTHWRLNDHVCRGHDFFSVFVSDHWDEALNPNTYVLGLGMWVRDGLISRCDDALTWYCEEQGLPRTRERFVRVTESLTTYYGEEYGHQGDLDEMVSIANCCFGADEPQAESVSAAFAAETPSPLDAQDRDAARLAGQSHVENERRFRRPGSHADPWGRSPLWWAAREGDADRVKALILAGADVNAADVDGERPLHWAARWDRVAAARVLLERGADASATSWSGATALHIAARESHLEVMRVLLEHDAVVEARDGFGCTPLHDAAGRGGEAAVRLLLSAGANPMARDDLGTTPLHLAARAGHLQPAAALLAKGADPNVPNRVGRSAGDEARLGRHAPVVKLFRRAASERNEGVIGR